MMIHTRYYLIYRTTNLINGRIYIGRHVTCNLDDGYLGSGTALKRAIKKYGPCNFKSEMIMLCSDLDELNCMERCIVNEEFCARSDTYNICPGGQGSGGFEYVNSTGKNGSSKGVEAARKLRETDPEWLSKWRTAYEAGIAKTRNCEVRKAKHKATINARFGELGVRSFAGKKHSEASKELMSQKAMIRSAGSGNTQYGTIWITNGDVARKIKKEELDLWSSLGYWRGRKLNNFRSKD